MVRFPDNRLPENGRGETMAVSHEEDAADAAIDRYMAAREKRRDLWSHAKFGVAAVLAGLLIWATFDVAAAIRVHAGMLGVKVRAFNSEDK